MELDPKMPIWVSTKSYKYLQKINKKKKTKKTFKNKKIKTFKKILFDNFRMKISIWGYVLIHVTHCQDEPTVTNVTATLCTCDVTVDFCDCCCDEECTVAERLLLGKILKISYVPFKKAF